MGRSIARAFVTAALFVAVPLAAYAAGLGKLSVLSPLGQPLNAEIEIVSLQSGEEEGLVARLASPDAFNQAGIDFNPALASLRFSIQRRNGQPVLKVTSTQPMNEPFLDMLVELQWSTGRLVREYTFLLDPEEYKQPAIAAAPAPAAPAAAEKPAEQPSPATPAVEAKPLGAAPAPAPAAAAPGATYEVKKGDTLGRIAREHMPPGVTLNQMLVAIYRANQEAFIRNNVNLVRAGRILTIPAEEAASVDPEEANQLIRKHMAEFAEYRSRLAAAPTSAETAPGQQAVAGRIEAKPAAQAPSAAPDQLRLSKAEPGKPGAPAARAAREDDRVAQERAKKEAESRVGELEKNVSDLQKLLALKNQQLAELEKKGAAQPAPAKPAAEAPKPAAEAPKPAAEAPKPAAEAPKPAAEAPKPAAEAPKPAAQPAKPPAQAAKPPAKKAVPAAKKGPAAEPSIIDEFLNNPLYLGLLGLVVVLLIVYAWWTWRRKKAAQAQFQTSVLGAAGDGGPGSVFGAAAAAAPAAAAPSAGQAPAAAAQPAEAEEVDPIAEADVYMAYGRDAQAEEILKEALQKDASRVPVQAKLLEIYAARRDAKNFEQTALKLKGLTNGAGPEWDKAAALGRSIDPQNGLYGGASGAAAAPAAIPAAPAAPTLDFDLGGTSSQAAAPDITLDVAPKAAAGGVDFDLGGATAPPAASAADKSDFTPDGTIIMGAKEADQTAGGGGGLDFDLGLGGDKKTAAPAAAPAPAPAAAEPSGGLEFDLNLDIGGGAGGAGSAKPAEPAAAGLDLSAISLDLGTTEPSAPAAGGDPKWQEVATKLDLAKAYEEMGDKDGARELLNEVMKDGDAAQKGQAQQLLAKLA